MNDPWRQPAGDASWPDEQPVAYPPRPYAPHPYPQPYPPPMAPAKPPTSGMAMAGGIVGIVSAALSLMVWCGIGLFAGITGILAVIFSLIGLSQIGRANGPIGGKGMAVTGVITGALSLLIMVGWFVLIYLVDWDAKLPG